MFGMHRNFWHHMLHSLRFSAAASSDCGNSCSCKECIASDKHAHHHEAISGDPNYKSRDVLVSRVSSSSSRLSAPTPRSNLSDADTCRASGKFQFGLVENTYGTFIHRSEGIANSGVSQISHEAQANRLCGAFASTTSKRSVLQIRLREAQIESPPHRLRYFIPANLLQKLLSTESIFEELNLHKGDVVDEASKLSLASTISTKAPKLFAILVYLNLSYLIYSFLEEKIGDDDLPFQRSCESTQVGAWNLCKEGKPIRCMVDWDGHDMYEFDRVQWSMLAPIFKTDEDDEIPHFSLNDNCILPFIEDDEHNCPRGGGFGDVWRVVIHNAHQELYACNNSDGSHPSLAVKKLHSREEKDFQAEVKNFKMFGRHKNDHLIRLLATYKWKNSYYLLFPYATSSLREFWANNSEPCLNRSLLSWALHQCQCLASGLHAIHEHPTSRGPEDWLPDDDHKFGRHGDIKAENILLTHEVDKFRCDCCDPARGILIIADFGLMEFHKQQTRSRILDKNIGGSQTYGAPETILEKKISRANDIWSLGCLYLEFITWLLKGQSGLDTFQSVRARFKNTDTREDTFYEIFDPSHRRIEPKAAVNRGVEQWIAELHEHRSCSTLIHELLELIEGHMLVSDRIKRIPCDRLNVELQKMLEQSKKDLSYLTRGDPRPQRPRTQNTPTPYDLPRRAGTWQVRPPTWT